MAKVEDIATPKKTRALRRKALEQLLPARIETDVPGADAATAVPLPASAQGRVRAVIDAVFPSVDNGRFAAKGVAGRPTIVDAHCFADGHDALRVMLRWRAEDDEAVREVEMTKLVNDVWRARFTPPTPGPYRYGVAAWVDHWRSWRAELERRVEPEDIRIAALVGAQLLDGVAARASAADQAEILGWAQRLREQAERSGAAGRVAAETESLALKAMALDATLSALADRYPDRSLQAQTAAELPLFADRERGAFSTWYELFPRSASTEPGRHGTFADVEARLPSVAEMGFDVLYFPPIHPIGRVKRKGRNNAVEAEPGDVGSPWAIGAEEGGHKDILPALGTVDDFKRLVAKADALGLEIALDIAFQCAPDHPYVKAHPQWFRWRPDGSVQYAENPPKKYQDIYPFDFETEDWRALWLELRSVFEHWINLGVKIFRVDNPHTKAFSFWEWVVADIRAAHPEVLFLAEAFTRPKVMHRLAKLGYSQSYTYFTWRHTKAELTEYFTELAHGPGKDYFRPNVWPNTPDILNEQLHHGGRPIFALRLLLAATLSASYGIYGPAFELLQGTPRSEGSEEYLDSEKYQLRHWSPEALNGPTSLRPFIARINAIRRENPALQSNRSLRFVEAQNDRLLAYVKHAEPGAADEPLENVIVTVVNLDPHTPQSGWIGLDLKALGIDPSQPYEMHDLLSGQRFTWQGSHNFVILDPQHAPGHVFRLRRRVRSEHDFDYYV